MNIANPPMFTNFIEKCKAEKRRKTPLLIHTSKGLLLCLGFVDECVSKSVLECYAFDSAVFNLDALHNRNDEVPCDARLDVADVFLVIDITLDQQILDQNEVQCLLNEHVAACIALFVSESVEFCQAVVNLFEIISHLFLGYDVVLFG